MNIILDLVIVFLLIVIILLLLLRREGEKAAAAAEIKIKCEMDTFRRENYEMQTNHVDRLLRQMLMLNEADSQRMENIRNVINSNLESIRDNNEKNLAEIRYTVDEKLHNDLERRLGESFAAINQRLEQMYKGLGEMQSLAVGVGDLKKVLTNVKSRGVWGEVALGNLLEQILTAGQYLTNAAVNPDHPELRVEYAITLPGLGEHPVYLPIDAKFPLEDYQALIQAEEDGDTVARLAAGKALENRVKDFAKEVQKKYICPPHTTDFAVIFLPLEGLYSELIRRVDLAELVQREYRVLLAGPTTISALLNSLQLGFRSVAVEQRASEVWQLLNEVKRGFGDFSLLLDKTQRKLKEAATSIDSAAAKTRGIERKLRKVAELPPGAGSNLEDVEDIEEVEDEQA
ncbi:MAG: DNA recombination protein RmuC [Clostridiales bacterium]